MERASLAACPAPAGAGFFVPAETPARRHLTGLEGIPRETLVHLLDAARRYRERLSGGPWQSDALRGVAVCNAFFEDSTRTRVSFELAERRLGAMPVSFGETRLFGGQGRDRCSTRCTSSSRCGVDVIVVRHRASGMARFLAASTRCRGDQRRRRDARAPDAGPARPADAARGVGRAIRGPAHRDRRRHRALARRALGDRRAHGRSARASRCAGPATLMPAEVEALGCERRADGGRGARGRRRRDGAAAPARAHGARTAARRSASTRGSGA